MHTSNDSETELPPIVVLIGLMGSGKTSVALRLGEASGHDVVDIDREVEATSGMTIADVFERESEAGFRRREKEAIAAALRRRRIVIACGGGAVLDPDNVAALRAAGKVILLDVAPEVAADRLGDGADRPLLSGAAPTVETLENILSARRQAYRDAAHEVVDANGSIEETVAHVLAAIR